MSTTPEASTLRKRRAVVGANFASRGCGLLATALFLAGWFGMPAH